MSNSTVTSPIKGVRRMGGLEISYSIDTTTNIITTSLNFDGLNLGEGKMTPENPNQAIWKNTGLQEFSGELSANYQNSTLECLFEITEYGEVIYKNNETVVQW
ncbi:hypothetical protein F7018_10880 [Tenacibaculum aiptasiae]|uniref:Uncharacterized protein n=1 Tax=Tenacibaculum aiptasiae TaxID=426481 RepID=A0A7J5AIJ2_9FLAO|nr:hypothetical protein [Tenacibaculum aiptasiae]KAB1157421.1 hypothetical protein F7018_10880 [Tenacibaculum aiptasiae]